MQHANRLGLLTKRRGKIKPQLWSNWNGQAINEPSYGDQLILMSLAQVLNNKVSFISSSSILRLKGDLQKLNIVIVWDFLTE